MAYWAAPFLFAIALLYIVIGTSCVYGLQSSWGYREFNVKCDPGVRLTTGHTLVMFPKTRSKAQCLTRCFAHPECQSISYLAGVGECYLSSSTKEASSATDDEDYMYCGPDTDEVWERAAITVELPTTTTLKPTTPEPNECDSNPCQNGVCTDGLDHFTCDCSPGYEGSVCDINTNECASSPCMNGACNDGVNGYSCTCSAGYGGTLCDTNINECSSSPCVYGTCADGVNRFTCSCNTGVSGTLCNVGPATQIRLVNGQSPNEGRVELWHDGQWGTVCDDSWDITDAHVACRQLGYPYATNAWSFATHGQGTGQILLDELGCVGSEASLGACPHLAWSSSDCSHSEDASMKCYQSGSIRLVNGPSPNVGRVEIYYNGGWGTVCDDGWDINDGHAACHELGYPSAAQVWCCATHGQGWGAIVLDDLACYGSETVLGTCSHGGWGVHNCGHSEDSSLKCNVT